jgi:hypothetical protein
VLSAKRRIVRLSAAFQRIVDATGLRYNIFLITHDSTSHSKILIVIYTLFGFRPPARSLNCCGVLLAFGRGVLFEHIHSLSLSKERGSLIMENHPCFTFRGINELVDHSREPKERIEMFGKKKQHMVL